MPIQERERGERLLRPASGWGMISSTDKGEKMALEALPEDIEKIGEFEVVDMGHLREKNPVLFPPEKGGQMDTRVFEETIRPQKFIYIRRDVNSISFTLQKGPIKEKGVNGCQVESLIEAARAIIVGLNTKFPCRENALAITKLEEALHWIEARRRDQVQRGVEGTNQN